MRISTWPLPISIALLATSRALGASRRSDEIKSALPPAARISATVFAPRSAFRPTTMTWMPSCASLLAAARPIPLVPPVTSAVNELAIFARTGFSQNRAEVHSRKHLLKSVRAAEIEIRVFQKRPLLRADLSCHPLATFKAKGHIKWRPYVINAFSFGTSARCLARVRVESVGAIPCLSRMPTDVIFPAPRADVAQLVEQRFRKSVQRLTSE